MDIRSFLDIVLGHQIFIFVFYMSYPISSLDYSNVIDRISSKYNFKAHDHLEFGHSDKPLDNDYLLSYQADINCSLYKSLGAKKVHIISHDYGTSVATEIIARHNEGLVDYKICSVTLCNGSMLIELAKLRIIQRLLKNKLFGNIVAQLISASTFHRNMRNIWFDKSLYQKVDMHEH